MGGCDTIPRRRRRRRCNNKSFQNGWLLIDSQLSKSQQNFPFSPLVTVALQYMRRIIQKKARFDIMDLSTVQVSPNTFIPALFGHAKDDKFIPAHHSDLIFSSYAGDKNMIKFDGDHNSSRPQFSYDSVSIFFYNVLHPPQESSSYSSKLEKYFDLGGLKLDAGLDESLLYEIIAGQTLGTDAASTSSARPSHLTTKSVGDFPPEIAPVSSITSVLEENAVIGDELFKMQMTLKVLATPLRSIQHTPIPNIVKEEKKKKKKNKAATVATKTERETVIKRTGREKFEKLEALSQ